MTLRLISAAAALFLFVALSTSCTKFDTTTLGTDLLPVVDNVKTFADTLDVVSSQNTMTDTVKLSRDFFHTLGRISDDPQFGTTTSNIYLQLKPSFYPYSYTNNRLDTLLGIDSVVIGLNYRGTYGDTSISQIIQVREVVDSSFRDSPFKLRTTMYAPMVSNTALLGSTTVTPKDLFNKLILRRGKDSVTSQIRIRIINPIFLNKILTRDSVRIPSTNNAYFNDSAFRRDFNGFAITASNSAGNGLMYINLLDSRTRLEIHYRKTNSGVKDTSVAYLFVASSSGGIFPSSTANEIIRNRVGFPASTPNAAFNYLQAAPGIGINVSIPGLDTFKMKNRIIHRAYLQMNQVVDDRILDNKFIAPLFAYLDLKETATGGNDIYKPIYFDLNPNSNYNPDVQSIFFPNSIDQGYYGGRVKTKTDQTLLPYSSYDINVSRYIQRMVISNGINYDFRIRAPFTLSYPQYTSNTIDYANQIAFGRVRVASGANPDKKLRMKLVVIYSKLN